MNQKYEARVSTATGNVKHTFGVLGVNGPETAAEFPVAVKLEISVGEDGFFLLRFDHNGVFCGDTWHQTIEEAKDQARFEYSVSEDEWHTAESASPQPDAPP